MQLGLFDNVANANNFHHQFPTINYDEVILDEPDEPTLLSKKQRAVMKTSPFAYLYRGKNFEEIQEIHKKLSGGYYRKSLQSQQGKMDLDLWYSTMFAFETLALENEYKKIDVRLCETQTGKFYLIEPDGKEYKVTFTFKPSSFYSDNASTTPVPHFEFRSDKPTDISETGYRSHFLTRIPYEEITSFTDFLIKVLRLHLNVTATIIFEGKIYKYDERVITKHRKPVKKIECPNCGNNAFNPQDECDFCGFYDEGE